MSDESVTKDPQEEILKVESKQKIYFRFVTYLAFFLVIFGVGLPTWLSTTSIPKELLMVDKMVEYEHNIYDNLKIAVPVYVNLPLESADDSVIEQSQAFLNKYLDELISNELPLQFRYEINLINNHNDKNLDAYKHYIVNIQRHQNNNDGGSLHISPYSKEITISTGDDLLAIDTADFVAKSLVHEVFRYELELYSGKSKDTQMAFETGANYHLSFFLLNGDGDYISWDFKDFYDQYLGGFLELISTFANFTVDSQIEYYSTLTNVPRFNESENAYLLYEGDTSVFVNHEKWNLDNNVLISSSNDKSLAFLNMILYVPSKEFQPLKVKGSKTNSFITPQYGGIQILNLRTDEKFQNASANNILTVEDLQPIFEIFISQIFTLLGLPKHPKSPYIRLDFLTRYFIINNLVKSTNNLGSLVRLINSLPSISIPNNTQKHVLNSFESIDRSIAYLKEFNLKESSQSANTALVESNLAFFEKEMVQQIYFPEEHKFAVYSPLLGPIATILFLGLVRLSQDVKTLKKHYWNKKVKLN
ncbi:GPI-anchor transamidase [Saccharomycopsis crataegensis]|uniref:GPI-anchor transamidase n=1 Tax=Saccharomycopsis crataegensis TaxID=43959 RepID=A0AAV5QFG8_9ASCO|nr:GPI-anchor transamidase [Saccharomycopsis crataegensis]